jgi:VWFA-related protein
MDLSRGSHRYILIGLLLWALPGSRGMPQSSDSSEAGRQPVIPMLDEGKGLIHLDISVTDANGEPAAGLHREDFELLDDGRPQDVQSFHAFDPQSSRPDAPVQIVLFLDTFGLGNDQASQIQLGVEQFLHQNGGHLGEPVSIFGYSGDGLWTVSHHDSTDGNALASDLPPDKRVILDRQPDGILALHPLAYIAATQRRKRGRKVLLWIGPGCGPATNLFPPKRALIRPTTGILPASSKEGRKTFDPIYWFATLFREARLSIDEISVDQEGPCTNGYEQYLGGVRTVRDADQRFLYKKVLAIESGGSVVEEKGDLVAAINRSVRRALSFYTLSFDPPVALQAHEYHSLQVRIKQPGVIARTNTGYYDEPFYVDQPSPELRRVTVRQLEQILDRADSPASDFGTDSPRSNFGAPASGASLPIGGEDRTDLAKLELTERVNFARLSDWTSKDKKRSQAVIAAADASAFLDPPAAEVPNQPAPDEAARQRMLALVKSYLENAVPKLPDFLATRTTVRYQDAIELKNENTVVGFTPLRLVQVSKAKVLYRQGKEVVEAQDPDEMGEKSLITRGTFGPLLSEVRHVLAASAQISWVRWESGPGGNRAVFSFELPASESSYFEGGCCLPDADGGNSFRVQSGYREEVAINPQNGIILRLQKKFDLARYVPMDLDEIMIDYGPVKLGGETYYCPVRSVGIARGRTVIERKAGDLGGFLSWGPYSTKINDMRFSNYHIFRAESRILTGFKPVP